MQTDSHFELHNRFRIVSVPHCPGPVARGLWWFYETHGLPIGTQCGQLLEKNLYPDWAYLCVEMAGNGWDDARIFAYICGEIEGVYSPQVADTVRAGLQKLLKQEQR